MKLSELLPTKAQLDLVQGVEHDLLRRRRNGVIGGSIALLAAVVQIVRASFDSGYVTRVARALRELVTGRGLSLLSPYEALVLFVFAGGVGAYLLLRRTTFLLKESQTPFRYTLWIQPFEAVGLQGTPRRSLQLLLHHDLMDRLNTRMRDRLGLLNPSGVGTSQNALSAHINIRGTYIVRDVAPNRWVVEVMPFIRIGSSAKPETIVDPITVPVPAPNGAPANEDALSAEQYRQLVERVYSRIATGVYQQILADVREKVRLFPTSYLRAVALLHEADDFARSNTIDSYDYASELYAEAVRSFELRFTARLAHLVLRLPLVWRYAAQSQITMARARVGYVRCRVYRRLVAALSGRTANAIFDVTDSIRGALDALVRVHNRLHNDWPIDGISLLADGPPEKEAKPDPVRYNAVMAYTSLPEDSLLRRRRELAGRHRDAFFEAMTVAALAYRVLGAVWLPRRLLTYAEAINPTAPQQNALWLLASAEAESDVRTQLRHLRQAIDIAPEFEIACSRWAVYREMAARRRNEVTPGRLKTLVDDYRRVLEINPGNIAAHAGVAYLAWLVGDLVQAEDACNQGLEVNSIARQTFVGDLTYGLARIAAERGHFIDSYELYRQALETDPVVGAYSSWATASRLTSSYYGYIDTEIRQRYERFLAKVEAGISAARGQDVSDRMLDSVQSFVLNDYGNAALTYFHRFGDEAELQKAEDAYRKAITLNEDNVVAAYNRANARRWLEHPTQDIVQDLERAERRVPTWRDLRVEAVNSRVTALREAIDAKKRQRETAAQEAAQRPVSTESAVSSEPSTGAVTTPSRQGADGAISVATLDAEIAKLEEELKKPAFEKVKELVMAGPLRGVFEELSIDIDGTGVQRFLSLDIRWDRLEESDVKSLRLWAEALSKNDGSPAALQAARALCEHLIAYYLPDDHITYDTLQGVYMNLAANDPDAAKAERENTAARICGIVEDWLVDDPVAYSSLHWAQVYGPDVYAGLLERAIEGFPNVRYRLKLAEWLYARQEWPAAARAYEALIAVSPTAEYDAKLASAYSSLGEHNAAIASAQAAIAKDPADAAHVNMLGNMYFAAERFREAVDTYAGALALDPKTSVYYANRGLALGRLGRWKEAATDYAQAVEVDPGNHALVNDLGKAQFTAGEFLDAAATFQRAVDLYPTAGVYDFNRGRALMEARDYDGAIAALEAAIERSDEPHDQATYAAELAVICTRRARPGDAECGIAAAERAVAFDPRARLLNDLGNRYFAVGRLEPARDAYRRAIAAGPEPVIWGNLGGAYAALKDFAAAGEAYRASLAMDDANAAYHHTTAKIYAQELKDYAQALPHAEAAARLEPDNAIYRATLEAVRRATSA